MDIETNSRFQILSLDGGGIKGLFSAAVLAAIEEDLQVDITDHFDLIAGTSTGGLIAIGLGLGLRPRELVEFYLREGPAVFPKRPGRRVGFIPFCTAAYIHICSAIFIENQVNP